VTERVSSTSALSADLTVQEPRRLSVQMVMAFISRNRMLFVGLVMTVVIALMGILAPLLTPYDPIAHAAAERLLPGLSTPSVST
jgi:ABC-type antimicrobial peptide transport system permease subunit